MRYQVQHDKRISISPSFGPPLLSRNAGEGRVQDHLSAHVRSKPTVVLIMSTCLFHREILKLTQKLFQHATGKNVGNPSYDTEKTCQRSLENCKVCGITTQINARADISNPAGKTNLGKKFPSVLQYRCGRGKRFSCTFHPIPSKLPPYCQARSAHAQ